MKKKVLEMLYFWTVTLPEEIKIADAYCMLKKQGEALQKLKITNFLSLHVAFYCLHWDMQTFVNVVFTACVSVVIRFLRHALPSFYLWTPGHGSCLETFSLVFFLGGGKFQIDVRFTLSFSFLFALRLSWCSDCAQAQIRCKYTKWI